MPPQRVLVIDDNEDTVLATRRVLQLSGFDVKVAYDGKTAIEEAREFLPEVVLCDIGLPGEVDGYSVAKILRSNDLFHSTFLVAITGYGRQEDTGRARDAGFDLHLTKPVDAIALARVISQRVAS